MFKSRRSGLIQRLWRARVPLQTPEAAAGSVEQDEATGGGATESPVSHCEDLELKSAVHTLLKRLQDKQLETLLLALNSRGGVQTSCVQLTRAQGELSLGTRPIDPHVLTCCVWRYPDLNDCEKLKNLPLCGSYNSIDDSHNSGKTTTQCCNPHHWSRVSGPTVATDSPLLQPYTTTTSSVCYKHSTPPLSPATHQPLYYTEQPLDLPLNDDQTWSDSEEHSGLSTETTGHSLFTTGSTSGEGEYSRHHWCNVAYWELRTRVGRMYYVHDDVVNIFHDLPQGTGFCLGYLQGERTESVARTRCKIGHGLVLSRESTGVWVYNRSEYALFINSPTLNTSNPRTLVVRKLPPGFSLKIFDYKQSAANMDRAKHNIRLMKEGPKDVNSIRVSFAKGWGPRYSRQFITSCPCWIEILLNLQN